MQLLSKAELNNIRSLYTKKGRQEIGSFIVEGEKGVDEAIASNWSIRRVITANETLFNKYEKVLRNNNQQLNLSKQQSITQSTIYLTPSDNMAKISSVDTPPGVIAEIALPKVNVVNDALLHELAEYNLPPILVCYDISDPGNLGTIIRTADWYGLKHLCVTENTVDPFNEKVVRSSMGSIFHLNIVTVDPTLDALSVLKKAGYKTVATSLNKKSSSLPNQAPICLILGSESHGLPEEIVDKCDSVFTIPKYGHAESLNVGVSCGVILDRIMQKRG